MSTAKENVEIGSTVQWASQLSLLFILRGLFWTFFCVILASPVLLLLPEFYSATVPFIYLTIIGAALVTVSLPLDKEEQEKLANVIEEYMNRDSPERLIYILSLFTIGVFGISFLVAVVSVIATALTVEFELGLIGIFVAILYPTVDSWLGRNIGYNVASIGGTIATALMMVVSRLYEVPSSVPQRAARDLKTQFMHSNH